MTTPNLIKPYNLMVADLFKVGKELGASYGDLMHAVVGIAGECGELFLSTSRQHQIEELGDIEFYLEAAKQQVPYLAVDDRLDGMASPISATANGLVLTSITLLDVVKKSWVYNQKLNEERFVAAFRVMRFLMAQYYEQVGLNRDLVLYVNQMKLIGPQGRYPDGRYSDKAAQQRADKAGQEDDSPGIFDQDAHAKLDAYEKQVK